MVLVLVLGDLHIPLRIHDLPAKFKKLLVPGKIQQIVCTGNVCDRETWEYLRSVAPDVRGVRGEYDDNPSLPPSLVIQHGPLRIGLLHGHQVVPIGNTESLGAIARKMNVDVLISGATHRFEAFEYDTRFFVNPGSATGAFSPLWTPPPAPSIKSAESTSPAAANQDSDQAKPESISVDPLISKPTSAVTSSYPPTPTPSFALLDIQGTVVVVYVYALVDGEVRVEKVEHRAKGNSLQ